MSMLHRQLLSQIMAAIDPVVETALTAFNPLAGVGSRVLLTDLEAYVGTDGAPIAQHDAPIPIAGTVINSPLPAEIVAQAAPAPNAGPGAATAAAAPTPAPAPTSIVESQNVRPTADKASAAAPLSARDVIAALMLTLQDLELRL